MSRTDHQPPPCLLNSFCSTSQYLPEWWLAQEEVACDCSSSTHAHRITEERTIYLIPSFLALRKKAHTCLWLISLLKQYLLDETSDCFSGVCGVVTKTVSIRTQFCAEEVSIAACTRAMARKGSALPKECTSGNDSSVRAVEMQRMDKGRHQRITGNAVLLLLQYPLAMGTIKLSMK